MMIRHHILSGWTAALALKWVLMPCNNADKANAAVAFPGGMRLNSVSPIAGVWFYDYDEGTHDEVNIRDIRHRATDRRQRIWFISPGMFPENFATGMRRPRWATLEEITRHFPR